MRGDLSGRIDQTNSRLDRLERRQAESEVRIATELVAVAGAVTQLRDAIIEERATAALTPRAAGSPA